MYFNRKKFQRDAIRAMQKSAQSYRMVSQEIFMSKSQLHRYLNRQFDLRVGDFLLLCDVLNLNPYEYIEEVEYQLRLL